MVQGPECWLWGRFQRCLQKQRDPISDIVGVAFFNVLEIPCFVLEEQEACVAWYWWGGYVAAPFEPFSREGSCMSVLQGMMSHPLRPLFRAGPGCCPSLGAPYHPVG